MPLVLAIHTIQSAPSATVPFAVILLQDSITNKKVPADFKCRQLVPSSGATSTSLWDVTDATALQQWLDEAINVDVTHTVYEVQEEFAIGLGEVVRTRAAEKVTEGTKEVAQKTGRALNAAASSVGQQAIEIDHRLRLSERATAAGTAIKESAVGRSAGAALGRIGSAVGAGTKKVLENDKVAAATTTVSGSFKKLGASLSGLAGGRRGSGGVGDGDVAAEHTPQFVQDSGDSWRPPAAAAPEPAAATRNPVAPSPAPAHAAPERPPAAAVSPTFTLDDDAEARQP